MKFYHYKPLQSLEHLNWLMNYLNQKLWFTRLDSFNDPFEKSFIYVRTSSVRQKIDNFLSTHGAICFTQDNSNIPMWAHYADNHYGYCVIFELDFDWIYKNGDFGCSRPKFEKEYIEKIINPNSKDDQEILPFHSHHESDKRFVFTKVLYQDTFPEIKETDFQRLNEEVGKTQNYYNHSKYIIQNSVGVKFNQWKYEEEYRIIVNTNSISSSLMHLKGYPFIRVTGIILGEKLGVNISKDISVFLAIQSDEKNISGENDQEKLKNYIYDQAKTKDLKVYVAKKSGEKYKIDIEEYNPTKITKDIELS